jgi:hypothetical protein
MPSDIPASQLKGKVEPTIAVNKDSTFSAELVLILSRRGYYQTPTDWNPDKRQRDRSVQEDQGKVVHSKNLKGERGDPR